LSRIEGVGRPSPSRRAGLNDRIDKVVEILARKGYRSVEELSADLGLSEGTVRRYLDRLDRKGLVRRTHGGAWTGQEIAEVDYRVRETTQRAEKEAIGRLAWSLIQPGDSVYIDAGSTTAHLAAAMDDTRRITVVTNSTIVFQLLESRTSITTIMLGGKAHNITHSLVGPIAEETVRQFHFGKAFLGTNGIDLEEGLTQLSVEELPVKKRVAASSLQVIVLADSTKFGRSGFVHFLPLERVHVVITDPGIPADFKAELEARKITVLVARPGPDDDTDD
jgi:DeoR/GlpR family transcriptional regulator of sugar metabolism